MHQQMSVVTYINRWGTTVYRRQAQIDVIYERAK